MQEITKSYAVKRIAELNEEILQLRMDLLDKETELAKFKIKDTYGLSEFIDKSSKKLAVAELEKVINYIESVNGNYHPAPFEIKRFINKQIQELKER